MVEMSRAAVQVGDREFVLREFALPKVGRHDGLLRVERCGVCGSDLEQFNGQLKQPGFEYPVIPGHEPVGTIVDIGDDAARRWNVQAGDRVVVESIMPCRECSYCRQGALHSCVRKRNLGCIPTTVEPALWGGFSEYLYLDAQAIVHPISRAVPLDVAAMFNVLTCGVAWGKDASGVRKGDTVLILGAGQRALACLVAVKTVGAERVIMSGLSKDGRKFELAKQLGADYTVNVEEQDIVDATREFTNGEMADVVIDLAPVATETVVDAVAAARSYGTVVLAGLKGSRAVRGLITDTVVRKALTIRGVYGKPSKSFREAIDIMEAGRFPLSDLHTHTLGLEDVDRAMQLLGGNVAGEEAVCVCFAP
jgi:threonine dehydrogenase-like Zn-dependent dehydrogenase